MIDTPKPAARPDPYEARPRPREEARPAPRPARDESSRAINRAAQQGMLGQVLGNRYRILSILGEGGMGTVYDAEHLGLGRSVALKVLNPSQAKKKVAVKRFQQEARAAGAIGHPNICEVYDLGLLENGSPFLVMEKLVGQTLAERIGSGNLGFEELVEIMIQVLSGLIAAHEKGIVHRDIKPENVFLARRVGSPTIVKILDFGVSKMMPQALGGEGEQLDLTRTGMVMGTPYYMSPEQARGERNLDGRVDVYACGVMMFEAIAGRRPFLAPNYNALLLAIINTAPPNLRDLRPAVPPPLEAVVRRAMVKRRDERYPSAAHMLRDVMALRAQPRPGDPRPSRPAPPPEAPPKRRESSRRQPAASPAMTLRSGMTGRVPAAARQPRDSVEIPIHVSERRGPAPVPTAFDDGDEMPTEIFRPGVMPRPAPAAARAPAAASPRDWDETIVATRPPIPRPPSPRGREPRPFNPDETIKMNSGELDFGDDTHVVPPRRRR